MHHAPELVSENLLRALEAEEEEEGDGDRKDAISIEEAHKVESEPSERSYKSRRDNRTATPSTSTFSKTQQLYVDIARTSLHIERKVSLISFSNKRGSASMRVSRYTRQSQQEEIVSMAKAIGVGVQDLESSGSENSEGADDAEAEDSSELDVEEGFEERTRKVMRLADSWGVDHKVALFKQLKDDFTDHESYLRGLAVQVDKQDLEEQARSTLCTEDHFEQHLKEFDKKQYSEFRALGKANSTLIQARSQERAVERRKRRRWSSIRSTRMDAFAQHGGQKVVGAVEAEGVASNASSEDDASPPFLKGADEGLAEPPTETMQGFRLEEVKALVEANTKVYEWFCNDFSVGDAKAGSALRAVALIQDTAANMWERVEHAQAHMRLLKDLGERMLQSTKVDEMWWELLRQCGDIDGVMENEEDVKQEVAALEQLLVDQQAAVSALAAQVAREKLGVMTRTKSGTSGRGGTPQSPLTPRSPRSPTMLTGSLQGSDAGGSSVEGSSAEEFDEEQAFLQVSEELAVAQRKYNALVKDLRIRSFAEIKLDGGIEALLEGYDALSDHVEIEDEDETETIQQLLSRGVIQDGEAECGGEPGSLGTSPPDTTLATAETAGSRPSTPTAIVTAGKELELTRGIEQVSEELRDANQRYKTMDEETEAMQEEIEVMRVKLKRYKPHKDKEINCLCSVESLRDLFELAKQQEQQLLRQVEALEAKVDGRSAAIVEGDPKAVKEVDSAKSLVKAEVPTLEPPQHLTARPRIGIVIEPAKATEQTEAVLSAPKLALSRREAVRVRAEDKEIARLREELDEIYADYDNKVYEQETLTKNLNFLKQFGNKKCPGGTTFTAHELRRMAGLPLVENAPKPPPEYWEVKREQVSKRFEVGRMRRMWYERRREFEAILKRARAFRGELEPLDEVYEGVPSWMKNFMANSELESSAINKSSLNATNASGTDLMTMQRSGGSGKGKVIIGRVLQRLAERRQSGAVNFSESLLFSGTGRFGTALSDEPDVKTEAANAEKRTPQQRLGLVRSLLLRGGVNELKHLMQTEKTSDSPNEPRGLSKEQPTALSDQALESLREEGPATKIGLPERWVQRRPSLFDVVGLVRMSHAKPDDEDVGKFRNVGKSENEKDTFVPRQKSMMELLESSSSSSEDN